MDYNINFKYKSGGGTSASGLGSMMSTRQRAIQASQKTAQVGTLRPDESSRKIIDVNTKLTNSILSLKQSVTLLNNTMKRNANVPAGGGGGISPGSGGGSGLGSVGASIGIIGAPIALAGFAMQKINQIGNAYIQKVSEQKGTVGIGGYRTSRVGAFLAPEVATAYKSHRMAAGTFKGELDPMALKMATIFGLSPDEVGRQSGAISRFGDSYSNVLGAGAAAGIETDLPRFMSAIASELEEAVRKGVNSSNLTGDISEELAKLTSHTQTRSVEMALGIVQKTRGTKESAARGQISGMESLMTWKAAQTKLMENLNSEERGVLLNQLESKGLITADESKKLRTGDIFKDGTVSEDFLRQTIGHGGYSSLVRETVTGMSGAESARRSMMESQKIWGTGVEAFRQWNAMYPAMGGQLDQNEILALWQNAADPQKVEQREKGTRKIETMFKSTEKTAPLLGVKRQDQLDQLLYKRGAAFADLSLKMEKELIKMVDTLSTKVIPALEWMSEKFGEKGKKADTGTKYGTPGSSVGPLG